MENWCIEDGIAKVSLRKTASHLQVRVNGDKILFTSCLSAWCATRIQLYNLEAKVMTITKAGIHAG
jgi:hypothetical protein